MEHISFPSQGSLINTLKYLDPFQGYANIPHPVTLAFVKVGTGTYDSWGFFDMRCWTFLAEDDVLDIVFSHTFSK